MLRVRPAVRPAPAGTLPPMTSDNSPKNLDSSNAYYRGTVAGVLDLIEARVTELRKHNTEGTIATSAEAAAAVDDLTLNATVLDTAVGELRLRAETAALTDNEPQ